jgi:hypothetical protein
MTGHGCVFSPSLPIEISRIAPRSQVSSEPRNHLHLQTFRDLACHALTTRFRLDKAEVAGSSPASSIAAVRGRRLRATLGSGPDQLDRDVELDICPCTIRGHDDGVEPPGQRKAGQVGK